MSGEQESCRNVAGEVSGSLPLAQSLGSSGGGRGVLMAGRDAACVVAQHGSSSIGNIQGQLCHLKGGNSQS